MPAGQKPLVISPSPGASEALAQLTAALTATTLSTALSQYKACADCGLWIPLEQTVLLRGTDTCLVVCSHCRWTGVDSSQPAGAAPRPPHASAVHSPVESGPVSPPLDLTLAQETSPPSSRPYQIQDSTPLAGPSRLSLPLPPTPTPTPPPVLPLQSTIPCISPLPDPPSPSGSSQTHHPQAQPTPRKTLTERSHRRHPPHRDSHRAEPNPSPYTDITRLRVKRTGKHCLYPGSTFRGVQKSGRSDYDVTVTILDVDFSTSFLCGYLEIRGLTEDWPELTTYFDAEIIGAQYSFLTRGWGATHENDLNHWGKFDAFGRKDVQRDLEFPRYTLRDEDGNRNGRGSGGQDRGCVFMRWKERFLVPDHRVKDINGASFAGFYYICVEYEPTKRLEGIGGHGPSASTSAASASSHAQAEPGSTEKHNQLDSEQHRDQDPDRYRGSDNDEDDDGDDEPYTIPASMTGFYFHKHSEPNQELNLQHVPDEEMGMGNGSFEWR